MVAAWTYLYAKIKYTKHCSFVSSLLADLLERECCMPVLLLRYCVVERWTYDAANQCRRLRTAGVFFSPAGYRVAALVAVMHNCRRATSCHANACDIALRAKYARPDRVAFIVFGLLMLMLYLLYSIYQR